MPNHITNYVEIKGSAEAVEELFNKTVSESKNGDTVFDFNGIIPMPESLNITKGSSTELGMACFEQGRFSQYQSYPWFAERYPGVETPGQLRTMLKKQEPDTVAAGRQAIDNIAKHGFPTWYEWHIANWGTKWNAYDVDILKHDPGRLVVQFDTAWSPPERIFDELVADGFEVNCFWQDEDPSNYGEYGNPWNAFDRHIEYEFLG